MTVAVARPLIDAAPQERELCRVRVADLEGFDDSLSRALLVEDPVPDSPLGEIEESKCRDLELVLEQLQVSTVVQSAPLAVFVGEHAVVLDLPVPLDVEVSELGSQRSFLLPQLRDDEPHSAKGD